MPNLYYNLKGEILVGNPIALDFTLFVQITSFIFYILIVSLPAVLFILILNRRKQSGEANEKLNHIIELLEKIEKKP